MNKKNLNNLSVIFIIFIVLCLFSVNINVSAISQDLIDKLKDKYNTDDQESDSGTDDTSSTHDNSADTNEENKIFDKLNKETPGVVVGEDNSIDFSGSTGNTVISKDEIETLGVKKIISKNEIINLGDANIEFISVKDGVTKVTFAESDTANEITFDSNGRTHTISAEKGTVEWIDGEIRFSEGVTIETSDGKSFTSLEGETKIKIGETTEIQGKASLEYKQDFLTEIKLVGKDSSLVIEKSDDEKTEITNINGEDITIKTGVFHNSDECEGNCISYMDMGTWSKAKIDGDALFVKYVGDEKRTVRFEDGEVKLYSKNDLNPFENEYDFAQKTVINYNNEMPVIIEKTGEVKADEYEFYDEQNPKVVVNNQNTEIKETQNQKTSQAAEGQLTDFEKKAETVIINGESLYDKVTEVYNQYEGGSIKKSLFISLIEQESKMKTNVVYFGSYGLVQATSDAVDDLIQFNKDYKGQDKNEIMSKAKNDPEFNIQVGFDYLELIEKRYGETHGFSYPKENYNYDGSKVDLYLVAYNAGPTKADRLMEKFKEIGGGDWEDLKGLINSKEGIDILGKDKVEIIPGYVENIVSGAE